MLKNKLLIALLLGSSLSFSAFAQSASDIIRLSQTYPTGTARSISMGGAFGALGADISSMSINPAGLGAYRSDEFTITPSLMVNNTRSTLNGHKDKENKYGFELNNLGFVSTSTLNNSGWKSITGGMAFNRLADFNQDLSISTPSANSSILDEFTYNANHYTDGGWDPYLPEYLDTYSGMAFDVYAIDTVFFFEPNPATGSYDEQPYFNDLQSDGYGQRQSRYIERRGDIREYTFSVGANYNDIFYIGGTLGFQDVYYNEVVEHYESRNANAWMKNYLLSDEFTIDGWGVNLKIGAIYRPIPEMRLGLAIHTPTWYDLSSSSYTYMETAFYSSPSSDGQLNFSTSNEGYFEYRAVTPWRFVTSWAYIFPEVGIVSIDYEFVDYSSAKMKASDDRTYASSVSDEISNQYLSTGNLRIGAEFRLNASTSFRLGYANMGNPLEEDYRPSDYKNLQMVSCGLGWRGEYSFVDLAYQHTFYKEDLWLYNDYSNAPVYSTSKQNIGKLVFTLGLHF